MGDLLLFVYGTLQNGQPNHGLLDGASFCGMATMPGIEVHDLGPFPMAIVRAGSVHGEVYAVTLDQLAALDRLEGVPRLYQRLRRPLGDGRLAWVYLGRAHQVRHVPALPDGRWPGAPGAVDGDSSESTGSAPP